MVIGPHPWPAFLTPHNILEQERKHYFSCALVHHLTVQGTLCKKISNIRTVSCHIIIKCYASTTYCLHLRKTFRNKKAVVNLYISIEHCMYSTSIHTLFCICPQHTSYLSQCCHVIIGSGTILYSILFLCFWSVTKYLSSDKSSTVQY